MEYFSLVFLLLFYKCFMNWVGCGFQLLCRLRPQMIDEYGTVGGMEFNKGN
jgi:hypothetical protein